MKKLRLYMTIAIINNDSNHKFDETSINGAIGGSETWVVEIASALRGKGADVMVFCACKSHISDDRVKYVSLDSLIWYLNHFKFDVIIISRFVYNLLDEIERHETSENVFIQAHDDGLNLGSKVNLQSPILKGVVALTQWHGMYLSMPHANCNIPLEKITLIPNGINPKDFPIIDNEKRDNTILWSSSPQRGLNILSDFIAPKVKKEFKDFKVNVCGYGSNLSHVKNSDNINVLGQLSKRELYKEMSKHKCWFYPQTFHETFCITSIEHAINGCDLIMPLQYGPSHIFSQFRDKVGMKFYFDRDYEQFYYAIEEASYRICESLGNYEKNREIRKEIKNYLLETYTWDNVAEMWLALIEKRTT